MTSDRLRVLDDLEPPDLWNEIEHRRPRDDGVAVMPHRQRAITFAVAAAVGLASILVATSAIGPGSRDIRSLDTSTWAKHDVRPLHLTFRSPPEWHVQPFNDTLGYMRFSGAIVSNVDHQFVHPANMNRWSMHDVPERAVVIALERYEGGTLPGNVATRRFPLDLRSAAPMGEGPVGWKRVEIPFVVAGDVEVLRGWYGPNSSQHDREVAEQIVASIAPIVTSFGGWTVDVDVMNSASLPLVITVGPTYAAKQANAHPWVQHEIILTNTGSETLHFDDTRISTFLGLPDPELLAADRGCGYARNGPNAPVEAGACLTYLDAFAIPPGGTVKRDVTLYKDLPGMAPLTEGQYVFEKVYRFRVGDSETKTTVHLRLIYDVEKA